MIPTDRTAIFKRHYSKLIISAICKAHAHTSTASHPAVLAAVFVQSRYTEREQVFGIVLGQYFHFFSFLIDKKSSIIRAEPKFSIRTLDDGVDSRHTLHFGEFRNTGIEGQFTGFIILAGQPIASRTQPQVLLRIGKNGTDCCRRNTLSNQIQQMAVKRRSFRIYHQYSPSDGS